MRQALPVGRRGLNPKPWDCDCRGHACPCFATLGGRWSKTKSRMHACRLTARAPVGPFLPLPILFPSLPFTVFSSPALLVPLSLLHWFFSPPFSISLFFSHLPLTVLSPPFFLVSFSLCHTPSPHSLPSFHRFPRRLFLSPSLPPSLFLGFEKLVMRLMYRAHGVVVSHPLSMREALGSIPSVSTYTRPLPKISGAGIDA